MFQPHPSRQALLLVSDSEDVSQCVDLELVKIFVDNVVEERLQLYYACVDFGLFLLEEGFVTGLI